jgi:hypothetical protein
MKTFGSFVSAIVLITGCPAAVPAVVPSAALIACVTTDALAGKSVPQMISDCGADLASVLIALLETEDTAVKASPAYHEAVTIRTIMKAAP